MSTGGVCSGGGEGEVVREVTCRFFGGEGEVVCRMMGERIEACSFVLNTIVWGVMGVVGVVGVLVSVNL